MHKPSGIVMMDALALSRAIHDKCISCVEVMDAYLDHIDALNPTVNAIVSLQERGDLLAQAKARDGELARGEDRGWMHGLPQAIKDLTATKGIRTTQGSRIFKDFVPTADAIHVERVKRAGAIIIGKTNTPEFGLGSNTYNDVFGRTLNAYDQSKTAGGSSGGAGVALALHMLPVADGTDHGGSLRNPAAYNNVFGFRPSFGRVPANAADAFYAIMGTPGPMARNVPDLAALLSVQAGYDPRAPLSNRQDPTQFAGSLQRDFKSVRVAWAADFGGHLPFEAGILDLCRSALKVFESLGCTVEEAVPDYPIERVWQNWKVLRAWQSGSALKAYYDDPAKRALMKPEAQFEVENGAKLAAYDIYDANAVRTAWYQAVRAFFDRYDYLVMPSSQVFPFDAGTDWPKTIAGKTMETYHRWMELMIPVTMSSCPALSIPIGFGENSLPMGLQIMGPNHGELACLQLAHAYDQASQWVSKRPPMLLSAK
ncbi:MAG: amidase [Alphaproteobacteria bacterium]|nr:amidase [Alphaproteobacteria bacterium]